MKKKLFLLILILAAFNSFAMPPHPDYFDPSRRGGEPVISMPGYNPLSRSAGASRTSAFPSVGKNMKVLVLMIDFADADRKFDTASTTAYYDNLFTNGPGGNGLSWKRYYSDISNGKLNLEFDVYDVGSALKSYSHYGENVADRVDVNVEELVIEAINAGGDLLPTPIDYSQYDNNNDGVVDAVIIIHQGAGEEVLLAGETKKTVDKNRIWSHMNLLSSSPSWNGKTFSLYTIQPEFVLTPGDSTIGVFVHEFGHLLGMPDLYDTSKTTQGIGDWGLMSAGAWAGPEFKGSQPVPMHAWTRFQLGWLNFNEISPATKMLYSGLVSENIIFLIIVLGIVLIYLFVKLRKEESSLTKLVFLPVSLASILLFTACGNKGTALDLVLADIESSYSADVIALNENKTEYLILENKVRKADTWTEYLPSGGMLISHVDNWAITANGWWSLNAKDTADKNLGVKIIEADGLGNLMTDGDFEGYRTDTFHSGNVEKLIGYTTNSGLPAPIEISNVGSISSTMTYRAFFPKE